MCCVVNAFQQGKFSDYFDIVWLKENSLKCVEYNVRIATVLNKTAQTM